MGDRTVGTEGAGRPYQAEIRWTTHGVPHVRAGDWATLGFGQGFACAGHHFGTIADQVCKVRGERARHLGAGEGDRHLHSDLGYRMLDLHGRADRLLGELPQPALALLTGYAAGLSAWLAQGGSERLPAWCAGAPWIGPLTATDLYAYSADLALAASGRNLVEYVARAEPPGPDGPAPTPPLGMFGSLASNGWAVGGSASRSGHGIVVANPHFPWYGEARFWECHLTIPGTLDVYGVSLLGLPGIQIGFNRHVAWTHTFSVGKRFTLYRLDLDPADPTAYRWGDETRSMEEQEISVEVLEADGSVATVSRRLWRSHHGPMLNLPLLGWSGSHGFTYRDANADPRRFLSQWLGMAEASDLDAFRDTFRRENGIPWVTTEAADAHGNAWFIDASHTPALSAAGEDWYRRQVATDPFTALLDQNRIALLDGSNPDCEWVTEPGAPHPGLLPFDRLPQTTRRDWVVNANESHWLANPAGPLTGYSALLGREDGAPTPRTRANLAALAEPGDGPGGTVDPEQLTRRLLSNRSVLADQLCPGVVERLRRATAVSVDGRQVPLGPAADVLDAWDHTFDLGARGAVLWRELMAGFPDDALRTAGPLFAEPFSAEDVLATPRGLAPAPVGSPDPVVDAAGRAVLALEAAGVAIDAPLEAVQWARRGGVRIPVHGGQETDGVANIVTPAGLLPSTTVEPGPDPADPVPGRTERTGLRAGGYEVTYGTSFVMVVEMTADGPLGRGLLTYGQSGDPASPHHADQLVAYAAKELRPLRFSEADILADPDLRTETVRG